MTRLTIAPALREAIDRATPERLEYARGFDAIVVGAGAAGGMAAMLLTQAGLNVLLLDAGWRAGLWEAPLRRLTSSVIGTIADPRLQTLLPLRVINFGRRALRLVGRLRQPVQSKCFAWEMAPESFVDDRDTPYVNEPGSRFDWFRTRQIGGRMVVPGHGRQYYRLGERDFFPDDTLSPRWPLTPGELDRWYEGVERHLGLSGASENCSWIPDGQIAHVLSPSAAEAEITDTVKRRWAGTQPILSRSAPPLSSVDAAAATGRLFCRQGAVVSNLQVDAQGRVLGAKWRDCAAGTILGARAPLLFLCASSLETTRILLSSGSAASPNGLGAASGALGRYLMDHVIVSGDGEGRALPGEPVPAEPGRCIYLPRFDLRDGDETEAGGGRGYGVQFYRWSTGRGKSYFNAVSFAEMTPRAENRVVLDPHRKDAYGLPVLRIACHHSATEIRRAKDQSAAIREVGNLLGVNFHRLNEQPATPGTALHECGTARMGESPANSVLDPNNQCWDARGLYVTDASAFPSQGAQNPTLTILALTARACHHAISGTGS